MVTRPEPEVVRLASGGLDIAPHFDPYPPAVEVVTVPAPSRAINVGPGLVYVHRDGLGYTVLDRGNYYQRVYPRIPMPERAILRTLLQYALGQLDAQDADDGGKGTVRG